MQYIDKSISESRGKEIVDSLLDACWNNDENKYKDADYSTLSKEPFRNKFKEVLLIEQNELCCYCMKKLENSHTTTLEHIIPHNASREDFDSYNHPNFNENVIYSEDFERESRVIPPNKYPHDIAYHNLIASCDSNAHCNHGRGDKPIRPLIYDSNINTEIEYDTNGQAYSSEYLDDLETLGISVDYNLILYRWIWAKIEDDPDIDPDELSDDAIEEIILTMDYTNNFSKVIDNFYDSPSKKPELLKYRWFFDYYREKRNDN